MAGKRLAEWTGRDADHHVRHIKALGQDIGRNQAVDLRVRLGEVIDHILLEFLVVPVADADEVVTGFGELLLQVFAVSDAGTEHDGLARPAEYLVRLLDPLGNDIAGDLDAAFRRFLLRPFPGYLLRAGHVDFVRDENAQRSQPTAVDLFLDRRCRYNVAVGLP